MGVLRKIAIWSRLQHILVLFSDRLFNRGVETLPIHDSVNDGIHEGGEVRGRFHLYVQIIVHVSILEHMDNLYVDEIVERPSPSWAPRIYRQRNGVQDGIQGGGGDERNYTVVYLLFDLVIKKFLKDRVIDKDQTV